MAPNSLKKATMTKIATFSHSKLFLPPFSCKTLKRFITHKKQSPPQNKATTFDLSDLIKWGVLTEAEISEMGPYSQTITDISHLANHVKDKGKSSLCSQYIADQTESDVNKVYPVNKFSIPGLFAGKITNDWHRHKTPAVLLRQHMLAIIEIMKAIQAKSQKKDYPKSEIWEKDKNLRKYDEVRSKTQKSLVSLSNSRGGGKSVLLNHAVMHAIQQNWFVLFIPKAERAVKVPFGVKRALDREEVFYQVEYARQFFDYLAKTVRNKLENIRLKKVYKVENNDVSRENGANGGKNIDFDGKNIDFDGKTIDFDGKNIDFDGKNDVSDGIKAKTANIFLAEDKDDSEAEENDAGAAKELSIEEYERLMQGVSEKGEPSAKNKETEGGNAESGEKIENAPNGESDVFGKMAEIFSLGKETKFTNFDNKTETVIPKTLFDLVRHGRDVTKCPNPASLLYDFLDEVNLCTEYPVFIGIDNVNYWHGKSEFTDPKTGARLDCSQLSFVDAFWQYFGESAPENGLVLLANSSVMKKIKMDETFEFEVPEVYSEEEMEAVLRFYKAVGILQTNKLDNFKRIEMLSGKCPQEVFSVASLY